MEKLFTVKSFGRLYALPRNKDAKTHVTIHWYHNGREKPIAKYEDTIPSWKELKSSARKNGSDTEKLGRLTTLVDQLFTWDEANALRNYLKDNLASESVIEEAEIPVYPEEIPFSQVPERPDNDEGYGFIELSEMPGYDLPFVAKGYFDCDYESATARYQSLIVRQLLEGTRFDKPAEPKIEPAIPEIKMKSGGEPDIADLCERLVDLHSSLMSLQQQLFMFLDRMPQQNDNEAA